MDSQGPSKPLDVNDSNNGLVPLSRQYVCLTTEFGTSEPISFPPKGPGKKHGWARAYNIKKQPENEISHVLKTNLKDNHITYLTKVQKVLIPALLGKRAEPPPSCHVAAISPPGGGKTIAYLVSGIQKLSAPGQPSEACPPASTENEHQHVCGHPKILIVTHTREVANQTYITATRLAKNTGIKVRVVYGGCDIKVQCGMFSQGSDILVATPGRLLHLLRDRFVSLENLQYAIIDEAHVLLAPGRDDEMGRIVASIPPHTAYWVFASTMTDEDMRKLYDLYFKGQLPLCFAPVYIDDKAFEIPENVRITYDSSTKRRQKLCEVIESNPSNVFLVLVRAKSVIKTMERILRKQFGEIVGGIYSNLPQIKRESLMSLFRDGNKRVMLGTYALLGYGASLPVNTHLVLFALPHTVDEFVSAIASVGHYGQETNATVFYDPSKQEEMDILKAVGADLASGEV